MSPVMCFYKDSEFSQILRQKLKKTEQEKENNNKML